MESPVENTVLVLEQSLESPVPVEEQAAESRHHVEQLLLEEVEQDKQQQAPLLRPEVELEDEVVLVEVNLNRSLGSELDTVVLVVVEASVLRT